MNDKLLTTQWQNYKLCWKKSYKIKFC